jgi:hypothetical protein
LNSVGDVNLLPLVLQAADEVGSVHDDAAMAKLNVRTGLSSIFGPEAASFRCRVYGDPLWPMR